MTLSTPYAAGLSLNFFPSADFEKTVPGESDYYACSARNILRILMMGWQSNQWRTFLSFPILKAVFWKRNDKLALAMRQAMQEGFDHLFQQLNAMPELNEQQFNQAQLYIRNCLAYLAYFDLDPKEDWSIPQFINGQWVKVLYYPQLIELTPTKGLHYLLMTQNDRVFAYGLVPYSNRPAVSHLIFMGTTYPAGQGFWSTLLTDFQAFRTPGEWLYHCGRKNLHSFIDQQNHDIEVIGMSLGGILAAILACEESEKLTMVHAFNAPGFFPFSSQQKFNQWKRFEIKPKVIVQMQDSIVCGHGIWPIDYTLLKVELKSEKKGTNQFLNHALNYAGFAETEYHEMDIEQENKKSTIQDFFIYGLLRGLVYYILLLPFYYVILPPLRLISWTLNLLGEIIASPLKSAPFPQTYSSAFFMNKSSAEELMPLPHTLEAAHADGSIGIN